MKKIVGLGYATLLLASNLSAQSSLDPSYGSNGKVLLAMAGPANYFERRSGVAIDAAGRVLVYGTSMQGVGERADVRRLLANGVRDANFGTGGAVQLDLSDAGLPNTPQTAVAAGNAADGGYWLAGNVEGRGFLARLDGSGNQIPVGPFSPARALELNGPVHDLIVDSFSRVWIVTVDSKQPEVLVVNRRIAEGLNDPSFGSGIATVELPRANRQRVRLRALDGDGAFVFGLVGGAPVAAQRLSESGAIDIAFGQLSRTPLPATDAIVVGAGIFTVSQLPQALETWEVRRLTTTGELDASFAPQRLPSGDTFSTDVPLMAVDRLGRLLIAGPITADIATGNVRNDMGVFRLRADGSIDASFGRNGMQRIAFPDSFGLGRAGGYTNLHVLHVDAADRIVAAGQHFFEDLPPQSVNFGHVALVRLLGDDFLTSGFETIAPN